MIIILSGRRLGRRGVSLSLGIYLILSLMLCCVLLIMFVVLKIMIFGEVIGR